MAVTDVLTRILSRRTDSDDSPDTEHLETARAELVPYAADPLCPWSAAVTDALDGLARVRARRAAVAADLAAATERHRRHREDTAHALAAGAPAPDPLDSSDAENLTAALAVLDETATQAARRVLAAQASDVAAWARGVYEDHARTASRRLDLLAALEDYTGHRWAPTGGPGPSAYERDMARVNDERAALAAAVDVAVVAAGLPRGPFELEGSIRPAPTRTLGADGHAPLLPVNTSTEHDPERTRIAADVAERVRITWQPSVPMQHGIVTG